MKGLSIALRIIAILGAAAAAFFWNQTNGIVKTAKEENEKLQKQNSAIESQVGELEAKTAVLAGDKNKLEGEKADLESQVRYSSDQVNKLQRDLGRTKKEFEEKSTEHSELSESYAQLQKEFLDSQKNRPTATAVDDGALKDLQAAVDRLEEEKIALKDKISALEFAIKNNTVAPIASGTSEVLTADGTPLPPVKSQDASVLRTDSEKGIFIISRGQVDGLQRQMEFNIAKGLGRKVRVQVGTVTPTYSVAYVLPGQDPAQIQQGDSVRITQ